LIVKTLVERRLGTVAEAAPAVPPTPLPS
jgi:hypothetical protein